MTKTELKDRITEIFEDLFPTATADEVDLVPSSLTDGKLYEAYVLTVIAERLSWDEGFDLVLVNGNHLELKSKGGPINRKYPRIELSRNGTCEAEIWTDIEFLTLSYDRSGRSIPTRGDFHELDIVIVDPGLRGKPRHDQIWLGVECKNTAYQKSLLREVLGVRRELSLLLWDKQTHFTTWPRSMVNAEPASCLLVYSSTPAVSEYKKPGALFGIDFFHEPLPD